MSRLTDLEQAIQQLEKQKDHILAKIEDCGWRDDRPTGTIPERRTPLAIDLDFEMFEAERRPLPLDTGRSYQQWYSASRVILAKNQPDRLREFDDAYSRIKTLVGNRHLDREDQLELLDLVNAQFDVLAAVPDHLKFSIYDIELTAYSVLMDDEVEAARHLLSRGFLRSAGALVGVVLERHLKILLTRHTPPLKCPKKAGLAKLNVLCKDAVYDLVTWRKVQHLTDLRNLCDHDRKREPTKEEVRELVDGVSAILRTYNPLPSIAQR